MQPNDSRTWWASLFILCAVLGALLGLSFKTQKRIREASLPYSNYSGLADQYLILKKKSDDDSRTIASLQQKISWVETHVNSHNSQLQLLSVDLKQAKFLAGLTGIHGPGVLVTLNDSSKRFPNAILQVQMASIVHDTDISQVVNELKAAGAEAIAVNNQRLVTLTAVRCAGPTIYVNNTPQTPPYVISAIGEPKTLETALKLPEGVYDQLAGIDPEMIHIEQVNDIVVPPYSGAITPRYAKPATAAGIDADTVNNKG